MSLTIVSEHFLHKLKNWSYNHTLSSLQLFKRIFRVSPLLRLILLNNRLYNSGIWCGVNDVVHRPTFSKIVFCCRQAFFVPLVTLRLNNFSLTQRHRKTEMAESFILMIMNSESLSVLSLKLFFLGNYIKEF